MQSITDIIQPISLLEGDHPEAIGFGQGCFMNVVSYLNGEDVITDDSPCVCPSIRKTVIILNDNIVFQDDDSIEALDRNRLLPFVERALGSRSEDPEVIAFRTVKVLEFFSDLHHLPGLTLDPNTKAGNILQDMYMGLMKTCIKNPEKTIEAARFANFSTGCLIESLEGMSVLNRPLAVAGDLLGKRFLHAMTGAMYYKPDATKTVEEITQHKLGMKMMVVERAIRFLDETLPKVGAKSAEPKVTARASTLAKFATA
jgi:hypothetical protein